MTAENVLHPVGAFTLYDRRMAFYGIDTRPERDTSNPTASSLVGISGEGADLHPVSIAKKAALGFDDHFKRLRTGRFSERVVSFQNAVKRKTVSNQKLGIDLPRQDRLEQHGRAESVYQSAGNGYVV
jgi:hypothetical protein